MVKAWLKSIVAPRLKFQGKVAFSLLWNKIRNICVCLWKLELVSIVFSENCQWFFRIKEEEEGVEDNV